MTQEKGFSWSSLIIGILFIITSLFAFKDPIGDLLAIVMVFGFFAIIKGIYELFFHRAIIQIFGGSSTWLIILGIIDIAFGVFLLFNMNAGIIALPTIFAVWFLCDSIFNLFGVNNAKQISTGYYWFSIIVNVIGIILGIILLFNPISSALTLAYLVGIYFMIFGIVNIVEAFS